MIFDLMYGLESIWWEVMTTSILYAVIKHFIMGLQLPWTAKENIENNLLVSTKLYNIYRIKTINIYSSSCQTEENG